MFELPRYLRNYLNNKVRTPLEGYVNNSTYYTLVDYRWQNYMQTVVRPCLAYGTGVVDGESAALSSGTGKSIVDGAARLVIGDKIFFEGDDVAAAFLSDVWRPRVNFDRFLHRSQIFKFLCGSCVCKVDLNERGIPSLSAFRLDRVLPSFDECGNVTGCVFFIAALGDMKRDTERTSEYWLVEERKYSEDGQKVIVYKVFRKDGISNSPVLPSPAQKGIAWENMPARIRNEIKRMGVTRVNEEIPAPFRDGLGVWMLNRTAANSCVPDAPFGDPLLFGSLDLLWSIDVVYSGSMMDVINGEGKILVPKQFLQDTLSKLEKTFPGQAFNVTTAELDAYGDESFVYVQPSGFDKNTMTPTPVQFDIRSAQYREMWELYQKEAVVRSGFSPTSIFPHLAPDGSAKTATEITAEENLTRASVAVAHSQDLPVYNAMLREVLFLEGDLSDRIELRLGDYIGNKIQADQNTRENYAAGLVPRRVAVQTIGALSASETDEYMAELEKEDKTRREANQNPFGMNPFNESDYFGDQEDGGGVDADRAGQP